jgi:hypothetical protein
MKPFIRILNFLLVGLFIVSKLGTVGLTSAQSTTAPRFGLTEAFWAPDEAVELEAGWERILFYWRELQPTGPDDWNTLHVREEWLAQANAQGRTVVGLLKNTAPWASKNGSEAGLPKGLYLPVDDPNNLWANFLRKVASYYGERNVHHWIIWNEPEIDPDVYGYEFGGGVKDYIQLLKVAYIVINEIDPDAVIHLAGVTWWHDRTFLERLINVIGLDPEAKEYNYFFDVISLHIYFRPESVRFILEQVGEIQDKHGLNKPVWINETNAPPNKDPLWPIKRPSFPVTLEQQAWYIVQAYALGFAFGAERIAVYNLVDIQLPEGGESFGLLRPDHSRRPAFDAYKSAVNYMGGFTDVAMDETNEYYIISFEQPSKVTRVMWARTEQTATLKLPALARSGKLASYKHDLRWREPENGYYNLELEPANCRAECIIGGPPLYLVEEGAQLQLGHAQIPGSRWPEFASDKIVETEIDLEATSTVLPNLAVPNNLQLENQAILTPTPSASLMESPPLPLEFLQPTVPSEPEDENTQERDFIPEDPKANSSRSVNSVASASNTLSSNIGLVFLVAAISTAAAVLILYLRRYSS